MFLKFQHQGHKEHSNLKVVLVMLEGLTFQVIITNHVIFYELQHNGLFPTNDSYVQVYLVVSLT